ncbi:MAG TPA: hypothetical protein VIM84_06175 [Gemmatimonadales bacterium]
MLRLAKAGVALVLAMVLYGLLLMSGAAPSPELALLSWLAAAAFILLVETSPI